MLLRIQALVKGVAEKSPKALTDAIEQVCWSSVSESVACSVEALLQRGGEIALTYAIEQACMRP